ncbi:hypothetical protein TIFTF001_002974 [Ficus carica]|uniref:Uncharacterized protein n=1 Tax=Ficus carica TaxID=3494 RepID=A0AA87ZQ06_FICCA|nr:hypothetical protein TIFTF001_002974 [Ficus carica]
MRVREIVSYSRSDLELTGDGDNGFRSKMMVDCRRSDLYGAWTDCKRRREITNPPKLASMAAPSPALTNNASDTATASSAAAAAAVPAAAPAPPPAAPAPAPAAAVNTVPRTDTPPKTLRGLNKPKCKQCGNVARSRCPYESCKSCCAKAQNPCHIHVLKANATFPDKAPNSSSPLFDQQNEASSSVSSHRVASFRQISSTFSQFNNVQVPLRSRKPLTRKDAAAINEWRFSKLKEYNDRNIEAENEAFDRYMQNVSLLEELFSVQTIPDGFTEDESESSISNHNSTAIEDDNGATISGLKLKLRSNRGRTSNFRKRICQIVDQGLEKLQKRQLGDRDDGPVDPKELDKEPKGAKDWWSERASILNDLIDKLNKARNEEDVKSCLEVKSQLFNHLTESQLPSPATELSTEETAKNDSESKKVITYSWPKVYSSTEIDQETLVSVDAHFSSLEQIELL